MCTCAFCTEPLICARAIPCQKRSDKEGSDKYLLIFLSTTDGGCRLNEEGLLHTERRELVHA